MAQQRPYPITLDERRLATQLSRSRRVLRTAGMGHEERFPPKRAECRLWVQKGDDRPNAPQRPRRADDRDRGTPRGATPPPPPGIRVRTTAVRLG